MFKEFKQIEDTLWLGERPIGTLKRKIIFSLEGDLYDFKSNIDIIQHQFARPLSAIKAHIHLNIGSFISHVCE